MRELSLNVLDVAQNSIAADAGLIEIEIAEDTQKHEMLIGIYDNGKGMSAEQLSGVTDPFFTTRTTRRVGMGIPLFKLAAEQTGGGFSVESELGKGTRVKALFKTDSIDFTPLGDIASTVVALITMNKDKDFSYRRSLNGKSFTLETVRLKEILGDVPLDNAEVAVWIKEYITEQTNMLFGGAVE